MARNARLNESVGAIAQFEQKGNALHIDATNAVASIIAYNATTIRVTINKKGDEDVDFSYAVVATPQACEVTLTESEDALFFATETIKVQVQKNPMRISFHTIEGKLLNQDDPAFGTSWIGNEVTTYKTLLPGEKYIGLGEKTGGLDCRGNAYTNWNTDYFAYPADGDPIYASMPFYMGVHDGLAYGIFFDNTHKTQFNFGASNDRFAFFAAEDGAMDYYFIHDDNVGGIIESYSQLTGLMPMPPLWSLGYQQCRYSYYPDKEVLTLARTFREKDVPADVIYLDIHYMEKYKVFTWDGKRFPNVKAMMDELRAQGFHVVVIVDPGVKKEEGYHVYDEGVEKDAFVKYPDGTNYNGQVWPGWCHFPDFTKPEAREWFGECYKDLVADGIDGFWNDMNEPANWGQSMPHLMEFDYEGHGATHKKARNVYGMQMTRSTFEGTKKLLNGKRPFVLTRAAFSGSQRYAAVWTGDNTASDDHMFAGVRLVNSMGLTGVSYGGYDVGGFCGEASPELYARWVSIAAFSPFFRGHTMINSKDSEPWSYGEEVEEIVRNYIKFRYKIKPYLYSIFRESTVNGMPVARSLAIDYTHDEKIYDGAYHNQYMFGPSFLVMPVPSWHAISKVYLPEGEWYDLYSDEKRNGNAEVYIDTPKEKLPVFVKSGSIVCAKPEAGSTMVESTDTLEIHLYKGAEGSTFELYEDDGETYSFEQGDYALRTLGYAPAENALTIGAVEGNMSPSYKKAKLYFHGFDNLSKATVEGAEAGVTAQEFSFFSPISAFDSFYDVNDCYGRSNIQVIDFELNENKLKINW